MTVLFYIAAAVAVIATGMVITRLNAMHALLYLIVSLLAMSLVFFTLGAPFIAALEVIVYAGAIMVLFVFVIMLLNLGSETIRQERGWLDIRMWRGPGLLAAILLVELVYAFQNIGAWPRGDKVVVPKEVGLALFGPYLLGVELASMLLLAALVGALRLTRRSGEEGGNES